MRLFGAKRTQPTETAAQSVENLRDVVHMMEKRVDQMHKRIEAERKNIRIHMAGKNRTAALSCARKKRMYENQLSKMVGSRNTMEQQLMAIETASVANETITAMEGASKALQKIQAAVYVVCASWESVLTNFFCRFIL